MSQLIADACRQPISWQVKMLFRLLGQGMKNQARLWRDRLVVEWIVALNDHCRIDPRVMIHLGSHGRVELGSRVAIGAYTVIILETGAVYAEDERALLSIGDGSYIGEGNNIRAEGGIKIGSNCLISQGVSLISRNHGIALGTPMIGQPLREDRVGIVIQDDVWIGTNAVILPGVTIETGAIVAAGSVVTTAVPAYTIVAGIPARVLKPRG